jgi:hypothetical protein
MATFLAVYEGPSRGVRKFEQSFYDALWRDHILYQRFLTYEQAALAYRRHAEGGLKLKRAPKNGMGGAYPAASRSAPARTNISPHHREDVFLGPCRTAGCPGQREPNCVNLIIGGYPPPWHGSTCYAWHCRQCGDQDECWCEIFVEERLNAQQPAGGALDDAAADDTTSGICYKCGYFGEPEGCTFGRAKCAAAYCPSCRAGRECVCEEDSDEDDVQ